MRCRQARKLFSPLLEGELGDEKASAVQDHLRDCPACTRRFRVLGELVRELSRMPQVRPTRVETAELHARLREALSSPSISRPTSPVLRWAVVAAGLVAIIGASLTWTFLSRREAASPVMESAAESDASRNLVSGAGAEVSSLSLQDVYPSSVEDLVVRPALVLSGREYTSGELQAYGEDIGPRMAFYSAYWYPIQGDTQSPYLPRLQEQLVADLVRQAEQAGLDPGELRRALAAALGEAGGPLLPCRAELVRLEGREAWLFSLSGPEDYLLFPDPQVPAALNLAARGGQESLRLSQSLLQELSSYLLPQGGGIGSPASGREGTARDAEVSGEGQAPGQEGMEAGEAWPRVASEEEYQALLREMAAQGNPAEVVSALQKLNYEQLILLLQGDWAALASRGVNLSDFLLPPRRLVAVDRSTGQVLWKASRDRQ